MPRLVKLGTLESLQRHVLLRVAQDGSYRKEAVWSLEWFPAQFSLPVLIRVATQPEDEGFLRALFYLTLRQREVTIDKEDYDRIYRGIRLYLEKKPSLDLLDLMCMVNLGSKEALLKLAETKDEQARVYFAAKTGVSMTMSERVNWLKARWERLVFDPWKWHYSTDP
jgi:hypothetical protein